MKFTLGIANPNKPPSPPRDDGGGYKLFYINEMSCLKFNKLVCLDSTQSCKYGSADSKTIIVKLFSSNQ